MSPLQFWSKPMTHLVTLDSQSWSILIFLQVEWPSLLMSWMSQDLNIHAEWHKMSTLTRCDRMYSVCLWSTMQLWSVNTSDRNDSLAMLDSAGWPANLLVLTDFSRCILSALWLWTPPSEGQQLPLTSVSVISDLLELLFRSIRRLTLRSVFNYRRLVSTSCAELIEMEHPEL